MQNIIFDFGNVLVQWHPELVYADYFGGDEAKAWWFLRHVCDADWRNRIDAGESTDACIRELKASQPDYADAIELYRSRWREMLTGEVPGMRELLQELTTQKSEIKNQKPKPGIYGLTNWSMETFPEARERFGILQMIDRYVVSGAEGLVKPDRRLFQVLLERYALRAEDCTFVDDNPANVEAARHMGMRGIVFSSADNLRAELGMDKI
ncbi:MAG: HAD family phosphatase [Bacteroidales bacterium]|nr:HAD family phosphatase [Bacteroidales bacterium]